MVGPLLRSLCSTAVRKTFSSSSSSSSNYVKSLAFSRITGFTRPFSSTTAAATSPSSVDAPGGAVDPSQLRNVAVIAHVDHGKTTLMGRLLRQCGADIPHERALDSISLERERGITIASKVTSISWIWIVLNMVDTPGHADFGGEVERVVGMVEGAGLVVDAGEGPVAQTKFVFAKALNYGLRPLLLLNKVDRPSAAKFCSLFRPLSHALVQFSSASQGPLQESIQAAVEAQDYLQIPDLLNASKESCRNPNPFLFLSEFSENHRVRVVDEMLQSFVPIRPRSRSRVAYCSLLSYILESPNPLPLALAIIQRTLRSGCLPVPQTHLLLSKAWIERRQQSHAVSSILLEMRSIGYSPDCGTCNYLILSLCKANHFEEANQVLRGMVRGGCIPDLDSYGTLISEMSELRMSNGVVEMVKGMVGVHGLNPRKEMIVKAVVAMRANRDVWRAVEMIEFLESEGVDVGFEAYELALEGCLEVSQFVLAGKFVLRMTGRGFIPYIRVRQRVFQGLVSIGETELASIVRQRFAELKS
ncbi:hypothetical protein CDL12_27456 [Handroanthus impetiginosus]|uniref:Tr-type G domain-containing protein n=1 Tax=Handroanthus impetiginosus TaxID=429701 RepID=A0A2G9G404_9LAMI|nr:hypothetical protein CDL12_27456 [Handroanthus impetiginosus]